MFYRAHSYCILLSSVSGGRGCMTKEVATILSAAPLCNHLWRGALNAHLTVARA